MADSSPVVSSGAQGVIGKREKDLLSSPFLSPPPPAPASAVCVTFFFFGGGGVCLFVCLFFVLSFEGEGMCLIGTLLTCRNTTARNK